MFRIGEFSRIARVSSRLLRFYDERGLLRPARVDRETGYRYYSAAQLPDLNRILVLKDLGLDLDQIGRLLRDGVPTEELRGMLRMRRAELEARLDDTRETLRRIEGRLSQIEAPHTDDIAPRDDDVRVRAEPARRLLSIREIVPGFAAGIERVGALVEAVPKAIDPAPLGAFVVIAHAPEFEPDALDIELGFFVDGPLSADAQVPLPDGQTLTLRELPSIEHVATCVRVGPPQEAHRTTSRIGHFIEANGYRLAGPSREVFVSAPQRGRMHESVVEMQFPVERAAGL